MNATHVPVQPAGPPVSSAPASAAHHVIEVPLGERSYSVRIGPGARTALAGTIAALGARRAVLVSARPDEWNPETGVETLVLPARDGEADKSLAAIGELCSRFTQFGLTRD
ncbi:hypothetical protein ABZZ80_41155, partial [Streptomyces sp. NPDC006356]